MSNAIACLFQGLEGVFASDFLCVYACRWLAGRVSLPMRADVPGRQWMQLSLAVLTVDSSKDK